MTTYYIRLSDDDELWPDDVSESRVSTLMYGRDLNGLYAFVVADDQKAAIEKARSFFATNARRGIYRVIYGSVDAFDWGPA